MALEGKNADYLICVCKKKTLGEVRDFIRANHITDLNARRAFADGNARVVQAVSPHFVLLPKKISKKDFAADKKQLTNLF